MTFISAVMKKKIMGKLFFFHGQLRAKKYGEL
jgi:hypothetical protein